MKKIHITALLALTGVGLAAQSASAATTAWNPDDLFLGFYTTGTQGAGSNILIDLGQAPLYRDDNVSVLGSQNGIIGTTLGSLLNSTFETGGAQFYNDPNLRWGLVAWSGTSSVVSGGHTDFSNTLYVTNPETNPTPPALATNATQNAAGNDILTMASTGQNAFAGQTTNNGLLNGVPYSSANDSWATHAANTFGDAQQFGSFQDTPRLTSSLDLYRLTRTGANAGGVDGLRGTFTIDNSGQVFYNAPTPEPTSVALLGGAGLLFLARSRRRVAQA